MSTLLIRLSAPLQSWGLDSKFDRRSTERAPTKSGVLGLCAAAMGILRDGDDSPVRLAQLAELRFGVRVDKEGTLLRDYHTAKSEKSAYVTNRYYLSDAKFIAGLEGDAVLLNEIDDALKAPMFPLFLGRRSCPPEGKVALGIVDMPLIDALKACDENKPEWKRICIDDADGTQYIRDVPVSFSQIHRQYKFRRASEEIDYFDRVEEGG